MLRPLISRILAPLGFCCALLCTPHCAPNESGETGNSTVAEQAQDGVILSAATWTLNWTNEGVEFDPSNGFSLTTNLGYRLHVKTGHVVLHRVALIPCPADSAGTTAWNPFAISTAWAHEEESDPSSMETLAISDVGATTEREIGANSFAPVRYCQVYWLVARGMAGATATDGLDMSNRSIYFEGTWERNGQTGPLLVDTWWPMGTIVDLESSVDPEMYDQAAAETNIHFTWLGIHLSAGRLFDDIEFATDSKEIVADSILDNIVASATLKIDLQAP